MSYDDMPQKFTLVLIEDKPRTMDDQMEEIRDYLKSRGFKLNLLSDETGKKVNEYLKNDVDIIATDKNITEESEGIDIIKSIRRKDLFTDILLYSAKGVKEVDVKELTYYTFIEIVEDKQIVDRLKKLIDKNLAKWEDVSFLRGIVISKVIELELQVNRFFASYFQIPEGKICIFHDFILENKYALEEKRKALSSILDSEGLKPTFKDLLTKIKKLQEERNLLAHCKTDQTKKNCLIYTGTPQKFDKKRINEILSRTRQASQELETLMTKIKK